MLVISVMPPDGEFSDYHVEVKVDDAVMKIARTMAADAGDDADLNYEVMAYRSLIWFLEAFYYYAFELGLRSSPWLGDGPDKSDGDESEEGEGQSRRKKRGRGRRSGFSS